MPDVCLYFQAHQPHRVRRYRVFDIGTATSYFDGRLNQSIVRRAAERCYVPAASLLTELVDGTGGQFRFAMSLSGVLLEQLAADEPKALEGLQALVATGGVELLGETYYHSLAALADPTEFRAQVVLHWTALRLHFGVRPRIFRHTELLYSDALAWRAAELGFAGVLVEGTPAVLGHKTPNAVYAAAGTPDTRLLPRNAELSDDIAFRFTSGRWPGGRLDVDAFASRIAATEGECVNLFMDCETFGEHHDASTGILDFLRRLPDACARRGLRFVTPSELAARAPAASLSVPRVTSWADTERDDSAWLGNAMQRSAHERLYALARSVLATGDATLRDQWRRLTTSDHLYYMSTKRLDDGGVHAYFSPFGSPYDACIAYMNVLQDLEQRVVARQRAPVFDVADLPYVENMAVAG